MHAATVGRMVEPAPLRRNRSYLALWIGQAVSNLGISVSSFAYPLVVLEATGSATKAGVVGSVLAVTAFVLRLPAGVLVDRWSRRAILLCCDGGRALGSAALATVLALGHVVYAQVLAVAFVEAALGVLFGPAETAAVRAVVAPEQRRDAVEGNMSRGAVPGVAGPPLGGVLLAAGRAFPFVLDAVSYLVSLACVASVRAPLRETTPGPRAPLRSELLDGLRWIRAHAFLRALLLWFAGVGYVFGALGLVILVVARDRGATAPELGAMGAITSAGAVAGALAAPRILRRVAPHLFVAGFGVLAVGACLGIAVVHSPYGLGLLGAAAFLLVPSLNALAFSVVAEEAPDALLGRVQSAGIQVATLGAPLGPVVAGVLLGTLGGTHTVLVYAATLAVLGVAAASSRGLRNRTV